MKIADLDTETRAVIVMAHAVHREATAANLARLGDALKRFDSKHERERTENLLRNIFPKANLSGADRRSLARIASGIARKKRKAVK